METIIVKTDSPAHAKFLASFLKTVSMVKQVFIERDAGSASVLNEPAEEYNWTNPSRPATDEEIEKMLDECEKSPLLSSKEARDLTMKELKEWRAKK